MEKTHVFFGTHGGTKRDKTTLVHWTYRLMKKCVLKWRFEIKDLRFKKRAVLWRTVKQNVYILLTVKYKDFYITVWGYFGWDAIGEMVKLLTILKKTGYNKFYKSTWHRQVVDYCGEIAHVSTTMISTVEGIFKSYYGIT